MEPGGRLLRLGDVDGLMRGMAEVIIPAEPAVRTGGFAEFYRAIPTWRRKRRTRP